MQSDEPTFPALPEKLKTAVLPPPPVQTPRPFVTVLLRGFQCRFHASEADLLAAEELIAEDAPRLHFKYSLEYGRYLAWAVQSQPASP